MIVIVLDGRKGSGFSVQAPAEITRALPEILRQVADQIENDVQAIPKNKPQ